MDMIILCYYVFNVQSVTHVVHVILRSHHSRPWRSSSFYRIFSFTFIIFFKILNFGLISFENSTENRFQSVTVTVKITDDREYGPVFKTMPPLQF